MIIKEEELVQNLEHKLSRGQVFGDGSLNLLIVAEE